MALADWWVTSAVVGIDTGVDNDIYDDMYMSHC